MHTSSTPELGAAAAHDTAGTVDASRSGVLGSAAVDVTRCDAMAVWADAPNGKEPFLHLLETRLRQPATAAATLRDEERGQGSRSMHMPMRTGGEVVRTGGGCTWPSGEARRNCGTGSRTDLAVVSHPGAPPKRRIAGSRPASAASRVTVGASGCYHGSADDALAASAGAMLLVGRASGHAAAAATAAPIMPLTVPPASQPASPLLCEQAGNPPSHLHMHALPRQPPPTPTTSSRPQTAPSGVGPARRAASVRAPPPLTTGSSVRPPSAIAISAAARRGQLGAPSRFLHTYESDAAKRAANRIKGLGIGIYAGVGAGVPVEMLAVAS